MIRLLVWLLTRRSTRRLREESEAPPSPPGKVNLGEASPTLQALRGFVALGSDLAFEWNTPIGKIKEVLTQRGVRDLEEHGLRLLRFEETVRGRELIDVQYELRFSPDYNYGLRGATATIEQIAGRAALKDASGSYRRIVNAYMDLLELLRGRYGEPELLSHVDPKEPEKLVYLLDHTREATTVMATWSGPLTELSHEMAITFAPKHTLRYSPVSARLVVVNNTGRSGLSVTVEFEGYSAALELGRDQERVVEVPPGCDAKIHASLRGREAQLRVTANGEGRVVMVERKWLSGAIWIH